MMAIKISYDDLQIISSCLTIVKNDEFTKSLDNFLKIKKDDYYFYGREVGVQTLEITTNHLEQIMLHIDSVKYNSIYKNLNSIYQSALVSFQKSIFLYGRLR